MSLLEVRDLSLMLPGRSQPIFENRSLKLGPKERISLMGPSGSGKTLFLRSICFLQIHWTGKIYWNGEAVSPPLVPEYRSQVIYVGQKTALYPGTLEEAFQEVFLFKANRNKVWDRKKTLDAFAYFGKPNDFLSCRVEQLSGGEKQIASLIRAIALSPQILCLDEPTSALDSKSIRKVETWLGHHFDGAWIWVTHQAEQAERVGELHVSAGSSFASLEGNGSDFI